MLPHSLVDLLCSRLSVSLFTKVFEPLVSPLHIQQTFRRPPCRSHSFYATENPSQTYTEEAHGIREHMKKPPPSSFQGRTSETFQAHFQTQLAALKNTFPALAEQKSFYGDLFYQEQKLHEMFKDLFSHGVSAKCEPTTNVPKEPIPEILKTFENRLERLEAVADAILPLDSLSARLLADRRTTNPSSSNSTEQVFDILSLEDGISSLSYSLRNVINQLHIRFVKLRASWSEMVRANAFIIPSGLFSRTECIALMQACLDAHDPVASEHVLRLLSASGLKPGEEHYDLPLNWYATNGLMEEANAYISRYEKELSPSLQRDRQIKALITAQRLDEACSLIHTFESNATPATLKTYGRVINALLNQHGPGSQQRHAQGWNMFSHMRYVAHPIPNEFLYTIMIRSIAFSPDPEAERALDLFTEMTQDYKIPPTVHSYNAVILVCARSKKYKSEAFRLARQMTATYIDNNGQSSQLQPNKGTFEALLEAAKRSRDLLRVRWLLGLMVKELRRNPALNIDEYILMHIFHAYASYAPPFRREAVLEDSTIGSDPLDPPNDDSAFAFSSSPNPKESPFQNLVQPCRRRSYPPQTHQDIIREAERIWSKIVNDQTIASSSSSDVAPNLAPVFRNVSITSRLIDSFMTIYFAHSPPEIAYKKYNILYKAFAVEKGPRSYLQAIQAYTNGQRFSSEYVRASLDWARNIWEEWRQYEISVDVMQISGVHPEIRRADARIVEKIWIAYIKLLALNWQTDKAVGLVRKFAELYPPGIVKQLPSTSPGSPRISLYGDKPLVRLTERTTLREDRIPPFLMFEDLELLHHRCVVKKHTDHVDYLTYIAHSYEGALWRRRLATLSHEPHRKPVSDS